MLCRVQRVSWAVALGVGLAGCGASGSSPAERGAVDAAVALDLGGVWEDGGRGAGALDTNASWEVGSGDALGTPAGDPALADAGAEVTPADGMASDAGAGPEAGTTDTTATDPCDLDGDGAQAESCGGDDCDDLDPQRHPGAVELCGDGVDNNCSGRADDRDMDGDGVIAAPCGGPDCHDGDPLINPFQPEICGNAVDEDCSGALDDVDWDGDGMRPPECGGADCDDHNPLVYAGAPDLVWGTCTAYSSWKIQQITNDSSGFARARIDALDRVHVAFQSGAKAQLKHALQGADGDWEITVVDSASGTGSNVSLALSSAPPGSSAATGSSAPAGSSGAGAAERVHISYLDLTAQRLKYATDAPGYWATAIVDQGFVGWFSSIAVDEAGLIYIAYQDVDQHDLKVARCTGDCIAPGSWAPEAVVEEGDVGRFVSLALGSDGAPRIAYRDDTKGALEVVSLDLETQAWTVETVESGPGVGWSAALVVTDSGQAHVSYYDQTQGTLKVASRGPGGWATFTVAMAPIAQYTGQSTALAVDAAGGLHVTWTDDSAHGLKYARCTALCAAGCCPDSWTLASVDAEIVSGQAASLALTSDARPQVVYTGGKSPNAGLRLASAPCVDSPLDNNCDGVDGFDFDGDGYASEASGGDDCNDSLVDVHPGAPDPPGDLVDWDCDGAD